MTNDVFDVFFRKDEDDTEPPPLKATTVRMPVRTFHYLEEMADQAHITRNAMAVQLIEWGVSYALAQLPEDVRNGIVIEVDGPHGLL